MNTTVISGRLVRNPGYNEVENERGLHKIAKFVLAVRRNYSDEVSFIPVKAFAKKAEFARDYLMQNIKDLLASREIENIFENSDFIYMLNQASGDRQILAKQLNISPTQLSYVTNSNEGEGLLFYGNVIIPFVDRFPKNSLYKIMTTRPEETAEAG